MTTTPDPADDMRKMPTDWWPDEIRVIATDAERKLQFVVLAGPHGRQRLLAHLDSLLWSCWQSRELVRLGLGKEYGIE